MEQRFCGRLAEGWCSTRPPVLTHAAGPPEADWTCDLIRIQNVRLDDQNLYFNAQSSWRWCEFSAHPRVMVYADETGAELTDMRVRGGAAPWLPPCPPVSPGFWCLCCLQGPLSSFRSRKTLRPLTRSSRSATRQAAAGGSASL